MPEYLAPGVFVEELATCGRSIEGVDTSSAAFVGVTRRGPTQTPTTVTSQAEYERTFGRTGRDALISIAVHHYFSNGGRTAVVVSVARAHKRKKRRVAAADLVGHSKTRSGIHALTKLAAAPLPANVLVMPDVSSLAPREHASVASAALEFCGQHRMFFILDPPSPRGGHGLEKVLGWAERSRAARHPNAAVYFPRVEIMDPEGGSRTMLVPASGAVAGIYARTDRQRGVWKAPAGTSVRLRELRDVELALSDADLRKLDRAAVNGIRRAPDGGLLVWGSRTFSASPANVESEYVNVRRLLLFVERSLERGLEWVVFEPNGESLWAQIRLSVSSFMNHLWRMGALRGAVPRDAYFVSCGADTNSEADVDLGRVNVLVGFAPLKPAEFVIVRIGLKTGVSSGAHP